MHKAYSDDKAKSASTSQDPNLISEKQTAGQRPTTAGIVQPTASLAPLSEAEARELEQAIEDGQVDDRVENTPIGTDEVLRVHGIYMGERREFEVRAGSEGKLELWDKKTGKKV
jgi:hypothetical protein